MTSDETPVNTPIRLRAQSKKKRVNLVVGIFLGTLTLVLLVIGATVYTKASVIRVEMQSVSDSLVTLRSDIERDDSDAAKSSARTILAHTTKAREAASGFTWNVAESIPGLGANFEAVRQITITADDVARLGISPLMDVFHTVDWNELLPGANFDLGPIREAEPELTSASQAVRTSASRLEAITADGLITDVSAPLTEFRRQLQEASSALDAAAALSKVAPRMLGDQGHRNYLLMVQNNAESRASGGIPGALAALTVDQGQLSLGMQSAAADMGEITPNVQVEPEQREIYSSRLGAFMQDVNLTPDFPTAASTAQLMWERKTGQRVDGVISVDPIALSFLLRATGPVQVSNPALPELASIGLPLELNGDNVVQTLLSDVYAKIEQPKLQDAYFALVAQQTFSALSEGSTDARSLIEGITRGVEERRLLVWSSHAEEQQVLANYPVGGSVIGPSVSPAEFGIYFNDGTGAKMDYYVKRTVQIVKGCPRDGYKEATVRITSTNTAPTDASTSLPAYVTGDGQFGVPSGAVETNIVAYGPVQAHVETAKMDGQPIGFAPYLHSNRPVGVVAIRLAPGESRTVEFTFGKIVQHTEPNVVVTPSVQHVNEVILPAEHALCSSG